MINFMKFKKVSFIFSSVLIVLSLVLFFTKGLNYGIDFQGGKVLQIKFDKNVKLESIKSILNDKIENLTIQKISNDELIFRTPLKNKQDVLSTIKENLKDYKLEVRKDDFVGPKIGDELKTNSIIALTLSFLAILFYVSSRFEYKFAIASILALFHDVIIAVGFLVLFQIEVNLEIIAALLTIVGYSLNDTIIVFDRIREEINLKLKDINSKLIDILNISINKTLTRTLLTSLTTLFVVTSLMIFGSNVIFGFVSTLFVGILVGTYSSVFVASSSLSLLGFSLKSYRKSIEDKQRKKKEREKLRAQSEFGVI